MTIRKKARSAVLVAVLAIFAPINSLAADVVQIILGAACLGAGIYGIVTVNPTDPSLTSTEMDSRRTLLIGSWIVAGGGAVMIVTGALRPDEEPAAASLDAASIGGLLPPMSTPLLAAMNGAPAPLLGSPLLREKTQTPAR